MDMKRLLSLLLALVMLFSLTACSEDGLTLNPNSKTSPPSTDEVKDDNNDTGEDGLILPDEDGLAVGYEGDTLHTAFFDMTIDNRRTCEEFDGLTPTEGYKFLVADLTLYNYTDHTQPMFDTDFEVVWDLDDDDAWAWPECDEVMGDDGETDYFVRSEQQIPVSFNLGIHKTQTGVLLYQVPVDTQDYFITFYEVFEDGTDEGQYGDAFYVRFSE